MQLSYFAKDGSYGSADGIVVLDTSNWTEEDFDLMESVSDDYRPTAARLIAEWIENDRKGYPLDHFALDGVIEQPQEGV